MTSATSRERGKARSTSSRPPARKKGAARSPLPETTSWWKAFHAVIRRIPAGRVCTYGAIAALAGRPRAARHVGFALAALKETGIHRDVPWHRVLGSRPRNRAGVSILDPVGGAIQRAMLEAEGVQFDARGNVALDRFGWLGGPATTTPAPEARSTAQKPGRKAPPTTPRRDPAPFASAPSGPRKGPKTRAPLA